MRWIAFALFVGCALARAQGCAPFIRLQVQVPQVIGQRPAVITSDALRGSLGKTAMSIASVTPFSLRAKEANTLSLLVVVWNGGLRHADLQRLTASLHREERLHLRLAVLTRGGAQSAWIDDPAAQDKLLRDAAMEADRAPDDEPAVQPRTADDVVLQRRWDTTVRLAVEDLIAQPGKQALLELLPRMPLRPPLNREHWRIQPNDHFAGEPQVHTFAALGVVPVYRTHSDTPTLAVLIPGGDAATSAPNGGTSDPGLSAGQAVLQQMQSMPMRESLPPPSDSFRDLGGRDVYEAHEALDVILADLDRVFTVMAKSPAACQPMSLLPLTLWTEPQTIPATHSRGLYAPHLIAPQWAAMFLLGRPVAVE